MASTLVTGLRAHGVTTTRSSAEEAKPPRPASHPRRPVQSSGPQTHADRRISGPKNPARSHLLSKVLQVQHWCDRKELRRTIVGRILRARDDHIEMPRILFSRCCADSRVGLLQHALGFLPTHRHSNARHAVRHPHGADAPPPGSPAAAAQPSAGTGAEPAHQAIGPPAQFPPRRRAALTVTATARHGACWRIRAPPWHAVSSRRGPHLLNSAGDRHGHPSRCRSPC